MKKYTTAELKSVVVPVLGEKPTEQEQEEHDNLQVLYDTEQDKTILSTDAYAIADLIETLVNKIEHARLSLI